MTCFFFFLPEKQNRQRKMTTWNRMLFNRKKCFFFLFIESKAIQTSFIFFGFSRFFFTLSFISLCVEMNGNETEMIKCFIAFVLSSWIYFTVSRIKSNSNNSYQSRETIFSCLNRLFEAETFLSFASDLIRQNEHEFLIHVSYFA